MGANFYLVKDSKSGAAFAVDPAEYNAELEAFLSENSVKSLEYILLTHGHFDHINGARALQERFGGKIVIGREDEKCFHNADLSLANVFLAPGEPPEKADVTVTDGEALDFSGESIRVIASPGHTEGGVCYIVGGCLFSGDTLFAGTVGRTDFPGGDMSQMLRSVKRLTELDGDYRLLPGHGEESALELERQNNVYCKRANEF